MSKPPGRPLRCAVYTRKSSEEGLEQDFNSLHAQREACEAYIASQRHEGWRLVRTAYDDGRYSGGSMDRPALQALMADIEAGLLDVVVVYKVDRLTRSLTDFARIVDLFDRKAVSFVSVTQSFNTTTSMGRLTLNVLLSFAQFEREVTAERIRDKIAASKRKGLWMGGPVPLGYRVEDRRLVVDPEEASTVRLVFTRYTQLRSLFSLLSDLEERGVRTKRTELATGVVRGGIPFMRGPLAYLLSNRTYLGEINHRGTSYPGQHEAIIPQELFDQVQAIKAANGAERHNRREASGALLTGIIYAEEGHRYSPATARKGPARYRSYVERPRGSAEVPAPRRFSAPLLEGLVMEALASVGIDTGNPQLAVTAHVARVTIGARHLCVTLTSQGEEPRDPLVLPLPDPRRGPPRRSILASAHPHARGKPMSADTRATLLEAMARGRLWLEQLTSGEVESVEAIAGATGRSSRDVLAQISLASLAPGIVRAAVEGALPDGLGLRRLRNLPPDWAEQHEALMLREQAPRQSLEVL